ncbi:ribosome-binding factor A [Candidatus Igneacidithiobacillus taiwanensis]|uniref:ribosome-binding factor A n=1 Tax=Candidatus Igneacidithiobacillus taiwanensis TaxID=1945924 RepID=UPI002896FF9D|nr:ribosome-binding factor A [Candidatus Igneacidithiobacillus taiwanensis]MCE5360256.1 ribosome-binding factor A [Acidithiobacillus sp.]
MHVAQQRSYPRSERIAHLLQSEIAGLLPHLHGLTGVGLLPSITEVRLAADLRQATILFSLMDGPERAALVQARLQDVAGEIRQILGKRLHLRRIPPLQFAYDPRFDHDAEMSALLAQLPPAPEEGEG